MGINFGSITRSYSTDRVVAYWSAGGLVGSNSRGSITTSYSTGPVTGFGDVGGLVGRSLGGSITTSYSTGVVTGDGWVGGLVGNDLFGTGGVTSSFWDIETSGLNWSAGGTGLTTAKMQNVETFLSAEWDFVGEIHNGTRDHWRISPGDYPRLRFHAGETLVMPSGFGTVEEPYLIRDARDLGTVWFDPLAHYRLESSLDLSGTTWSMAVVPWFGGTFDGNGHVISNLQMTGGGRLGMFGLLDSGASISNLGLEAVDVNGTSWAVGGLAGRVWGGNIIACYSTGTVTGRDSVGGLVGSSSRGSIITTSYSNCTVTGSGQVGGLVGQV